MTKFNKTLFNLLLTALCTSSYSAIAFDLEKTFCTSGKSHITKLEYSPKFICTQKPIDILEDTNEQKHKLHFGFCLSKSTKNGSFIVNQFILKQYSEDGMQDYYKRLSSRQYYWREDKRDIGLEKLNEIALYDKKNQTLISDWFKSDYDNDISINKKTQTAKVLIPFSLYKPLISEDDDNQYLTLNCKKL